MEEQRLDLTLFSEKIERLRQEIAKVIVGQDEAIELVLTSILANGHVLIEGVPGVAKTLLARLIARLVDAGFSRVQFTPDLMPSDLLGINIFNVKTQEFEFHQGPVFSDIVLVDEINRAPAKTQAALFEVMEERQEHRWRYPQDGRFLYHPCHPEPRGAGRNLSPARGSARPFPDEDNDGLSFAG